MPPAKTSEAGKIERLISLAYLLSTHDEIAIDELQERFNLSEKEVEEDLNQLMFCGLPPYSPDQLFDISIEDGFVSMYYNDIFVAPLKLNDSEKSNATIALTRLREESSDIEKKKIDDILELINASSKQVIDVDNSSQYISIFAEAIDKNREVEIVYLSLNSGSIDSRIIDPKKILTTASSSYIYAYCHKDEKMKLFRSDRISNATLLDTEAQSDFENIDLELDGDENVPFLGSSNDFLILEVGQDASWILDTYPNEELNSEKSQYKFNISNPFIAARLFLSAPRSIKYIDGSIDKSAIVEAVKVIKNRPREFS